MLAGSSGPSFVTASVDASREHFRLSSMRPVGRGEVDGVLDELVEHLDDQLRRAARRAGLVGRVELDATTAVDVAIRRDGAAQELAQVEGLELDALDALLDACRFAHRRQDRAQAVRAFLRAAGVDRGILAERVLREILERGLHDRERRAQLVRELARERLEIFGVLAQALEQRREAAREVADLVARADAGHLRGDAAAGVERALCGVAQPADAQR